AEYDTPMMSSSALRFVSDLEKALEEQIKGNRVDFVSTIGEGQFDIYAIHQLEMLVMLLGTGAKRVKQCGTDIVSHMLVDYEDGRRGTVTMMPGQPLQLNACYGEESGFTLTSMGDFFAGFIEAMLSFFESGESRIPVEQTLEIAALLETGSLAIKQPDKWLALIND
ncbi:MAG: oxidoreductase, partial [bacterium]|nr:oxidoreductase [bacterium]